MYKPVEIENTVLGTLIHYPNLYYQHQSKLSVSLFTKSENQMIYQGIEQILNENKPLDMLILINELKKKGNYIDKYIVELMLGVSSSANFEYHLMILVERNVKRDFVTKFSHLLQLAKTDEDIFNIREKAFEYFDNLFLDSFIERNQNLQTFENLINAVQENFSKLTNGQSTGIGSSLEIINKAFGGWQNSDLTIVAGRPGMGKTAFMVQQIIDCIQQNVAVGCFSLEMSAEQIAARLVTNYTGIPNSAILRKGLKDEEIQIYFSLKDDLIKFPVHIDDTPAISIQDLRVKAKMMKLRYNIGILFVDYLQLITFEKALNREQEIGNISRKLKALAKELNIPIIALSQLSRQVENRPNKRPQLSDLRDSGSIEQDGDEVIFLYRPEYYGITEWDDYNQELTNNEAEIIIQKNRHGGILSERCRVNMATSKFMNLNYY